MRITDARAETPGVELVSLVFSMTVVDYAFDHVSRPAIGRIVAICTALCSLVIWILTILGRINDALGLPSGTVGLAISAFLLRNLFHTYQRPRVAVHGVMPS